MRQQRTLVLPLSASVVLHAVAVVGLFVVKDFNRQDLPPVYKVTLVSAPVGTPSLGVVSPPRRQPATKQAPPRLSRPVPTKSTRAPAQKAVRASATPPQPKAPPPKAAEQTRAAGAAGGAGTDAAAVQLDGLDFPYPGYLSNIVNQIRVRFTKEWPAAYKAQFQFLIRRDGSVSGLRLLDGKGASLEFRLEAQSAIESAGKVKAFGALPDGFTDDVLPVVFTFDPRILK
jgi:hypothetical protein